MDLAGTSVSQERSLLKPNPTNRLLSKSIPVLLVRYSDSFVLQTKANSRTFLEVDSRSSIKSAGYSLKPEKTQKEKRREKHLFYFLENSWALTCTSRVLGESGSSMNEEEDGVVPIAGFASAAQRAAYVARMRASPESLMFLNAVGDERR